MSWQPAHDAMSQTTAARSLETVVVPRTRDLGGFEVRRVLPSIERRMVGPFVFFDEMGPTLFAPGTGIDVRPHPHVGLATVTYLFDGEILHRDNLGSVQPIQPGEINWMTAGRGIAHSERTATAVRAAGGRLAGIQSWVALPKKDEETAPAFAHHGSATLPIVSGEGKTVRLLVGALYGARSPVQSFSETLYADIALEADAKLPIPAEHEERAIYLVNGTVEIAGEAFAPGRLLVLRPRAEITVTSRSVARLMLLGGAPMDGPRHIWWNFVSSSADRIEQAKADWKAGRFPAVAGDPEFIPLPE
jgi:redox-sensitive bicupin YhaK (pirin superfamily)